MIGPGLFSFTFAWFIATQHGLNFPGAPWYLAAAMLLVAMALTFTVEQPQKAVEPPAELATGSN